MAKASIKDCAKSLTYLRPLRDGGYISDEDDDRIVGSVRRDLAKNGGTAGLEREGRRKRMQRGGYVPPDFHIPAPQPKHANNENYGPHDEESLNWHEKAGYHGMTPLGGYDDPMGEVTDPRWPSLADSVHAVAAPIVAEHQQPWNLSRASDVAQRALMGLGSSPGAAPFVEGAVYGTGGPSPAALAAGSRSESRRAPEIRPLPGGGYRRGGKRGGYDPELPSSSPGQQFAGANQAQAEAPGSYQAAPMQYQVGGYGSQYRVGGKSNNYRVGGYGQMPFAYRQQINAGGGYNSAAANPMGPARGRFADLRGIHSQTHAGGYASDGGRQPVLVHERSYYTDEAPSLFRDARGVSDGAMQRLRNALMGMFDDR